MKAWVILCLVTDYGSTLKTLQPIIGPIFAGLQAGLVEAEERSGAKTWRRIDDPWYYAHTVRRVAVEEFREQGSQVLHERTGRPLLHMSGLLVSYQDYHVRILKGTGKASTPAELETLPIPGRSRRRQAFWRQEPALPGLAVENLLLVWLDVNGVLAPRATLAKPIAGNQARNSTRVDWDGLISPDMAAARAEDLLSRRPENIHYSLFAKSGV